MQQIIYSLPPELLLSMAIRRPCPEFLLLLFLLMANSITALWDIMFRPSVQSDTLGGGGQAIL